MCAYCAWGTHDACASCSPCGTLDLREPSTASTQGWTPEASHLGSFRACRAVSSFGGLQPWFESWPLTLDRGGPLVRGRDPFPNPQHTPPQNVTELRSFYVVEFENMKIM
jgi:hypothetical protein